MVTQPDYHEDIIAEIEGVKVSRCERRNCRKMARTGSRWCQGHAYVGEGYQEKPRELIQESTETDMADSLLSRLGRMFGLKK